MEDVGDVDTRSGRREAWKAQRILPPSLITWGKDGDVGMLRKEEGEEDEEEEVDTKRETEGRVRGEMKRE